MSGGPLVDQELLSRVRGGLLSAFDGQLTHLEGLVVVRSPEPEGIAAEQRPKPTAASRTGCSRASPRRACAPVGRRADGHRSPPQIPWFKGHKLSSVDDLDEQAGQAALLYALAGNAGSFGVKTTADSLLPTRQLERSGRGRRGGHQHDERAVRSVRRPRR